MITLPPIIGPDARKPKGEVGGGGGNRHKIPSQRNRDIVAKHY